MMKVLTTLLLAALTTMAADNIHEFTMKSIDGQPTPLAKYKGKVILAVNEEGLTYQNYGATAPGGWSYDYGKGRVCYLSPGHMLSDLWHPEYIKLQQNAVRWIMRQKA